MLNDDKFTSSNEKELEKLHETLDSGNDSLREDDWLDASSKHPIRQR